MGKRINTAVWLENQNRWQIKVQKNGERKTFTSSKTGRTGQREANAKADAWLDENIISTNAKTGNLLDEFLEGIKLRSSLSNYKKEQYFVNNFIRPNIERKKISSLTEQDLQDIINKSYARKGKEPLSKKTLLGLKSTIVNFAKFLRRKNIVKIFYDDLSIPSGAKTSVKRILQPEDLIKLFSCDTIRYKDKDIFDDFVYAYRFAILTGLRPGEIIGLKKEDIHKNTIRVQRAINAQNEITHGKNQNAIRSIALSPLMSDILNKQLALSPSSEYLFNINSQSTYRHRWQKFCEYNNIEYVSLYEMRHTFVSIAKQLPEGAVKQIVGHSKTMDTFGIYGHEIEGERESNANKLNEIFMNLLQSNSN